MPVYLLGTLDTKRHEITFVRDLLHEYGVKTYIVDAGCLGSPLIAADVTREQVFAAAGVSLETRTDIETPNATVFVPLTPGKSIWSRCVSLDTVPRASASETNLKFRGDGLPHSNAATQHEL